MKTLVKCNMRSFLIISVVLSLYISLANGRELNFYDEDGNVFTLTITGGCYNFKPKWDKRATSIELEDDGCFNLYDRHDCRGSQIRVNGGSRAIRKLSQANFDRSVSSVNLCSPDDEEQTVRINRGNLMMEVRQGDKSTIVPRATLQEVREAAVEEHNKYRQKHGVPPLRGDEELHEEAQKWAEHLAATHRFEPSRTFRYGENLATSFRRKKVDAVKDAIKRWYDKIKNYDFERPGYNVDDMPNGSFTAVVWKNTTKLGIGIAWDEREEGYIVVAFYEPQGLHSPKRFSFEAFDLAEANSGKTSHHHWNEHFHRVSAAFILLGIFNSVVFNGCSRVRWST